MGGTVGGSLDVVSIVNELMKKQSVPLNRMSYEAKNEEVKLSLYAQFKNVIDNINKSVDNLKNAFNGISFAATVSNSSVLSASITTNENVFAAIHTIAVTTLAQSETLGSNTQFAERNQALNITGDLNLTIGTQLSTINVVATDTLENVRDHINKAANNPGVTASILASTDTNGQPVYSLVIASNKTGLSEKLSLSGTAVVAFDLTHEISEAKNAVFSVDGKNVIRSQNTISDVLDGVTFNLLGAGSSALTITQNNSDKNKVITSGVQGLVDQYNATMDYIDQSLADHSLTDSSVTMIKMTVHALFATKLNNATGINSLFDMGIKTAEAVKSSTKQGFGYTAGDRLKLDNVKLQKVLTADPAALQQFFLDKTNGFIGSATKTFNGISQFGGIIANRTQSINENISKIERKIGDEENRLEFVKKLLTSRYADLSIMMDKFDKLSGMLDNIYSNLSFNNKK